MNQRYALPSQTRPIMDSGEWRSQKVQRVLRANTRTYSEATVIGMVASPVVRP